MAAIVAPSRGRFAAGWGLQRLWPLLTAGLHRMEIDVIVAPSRGRLCSRVMIDVIVAPSSGRFGAGWGLQ